MKYGRRVWLDSVMMNLVGADEDEILPLRYLLLKVEWNMNSR